MSIGKTHGGGGSTVARVERGEGFMVFFFPATLSISNRMAILALYIHVTIFNKHQCNMYVQACLQRILPEG